MPLAFTLFIETLFTSPTYFFMVVIAVVVSIVLHELGHGFAALSQGDPTPKAAGRMTLDPMVHMGPTSLIMLALLGIAWGVMPVNPRNFKSRYGEALVAFAGPFVNVLLAVVSAAVLGVWMRFGGLAGSGIAANGQQFLLVMINLNLLLAMFNMIPIPPLDGASVLGSFVPGFKTFSANPDNQPFLLGGFILVFFVAFDYLFPAASAGTAFLVNLFGGIA